MKGSTLEKEKARCEQAQGDLDELYSSIFSGPTPEIPGEDEVEQDLQQAEKVFEEARMQSDRDTQALDALRRCEIPVKHALEDMDDARGSSQFDMLGGGAFADVMEHDALARGQMQLSQVLLRYGEAMRAQPAIPPLSEVNIDQGHFVSDILFDNLFTDAAQHARIKSAQQQMLRAANHLKAQIGRQQEATRASQEHLKQARSQLADARKRLQGIRSEAFEQYSSGGPPAYSV